MHKRGKFCNSVSRNLSYVKTYKSTQNCAYKDIRDSIVGKMNIENCLNVSVNRTHLTVYIISGV